MSDTFHTKDLSQSSFLITGGAGFIGSHIAEYLLKHGAKKVRALDNLSNGFQTNLDILKKYPAFEFTDGDIRNFETCSQACTGMDYVSHQAALGSVPRSIKEPVYFNEVNVGGFVNMLKASIDNNVKQFVYASSSSVYGDEPTLPKQEERIGNCLSPYAATKKTNELYAQVFADVYGIKLMGFRYFNIFLHGIINKSKIPGLSTIAIDKNLSTVHNVFYKQWNYCSVGPIRILAWAKNIEIPEAQ